MARELKGYARKRKMGLVPHRYPGTRDMRGVWPPVGAAEMGRALGETIRRGGQSGHAAD